MAKNFAYAYTESPLPVDEQNSDNAEGGEIPEYPDGNGILRMILKSFSGTDNYVMAKRIDVNDEEYGDEVIVNLPVSLWHKLSINEQSYTYSDFNNRTRDGNAQRIQPIFEVGDELVVIQVRNQFGMVTDGRMWCEVWYA